MSKTKGPGLLMTPNPYHTPGYAGYCPQLKFEIGDTFGRTTNRLLNNAKVTSSGCGLLADLYLPPVSKDGFMVTESSGEKQQVIKNRFHRWGNQKLSENMVPGYTGFIPKSGNFFGKRYTLTCDDAIYEFETESRDLTRRRQQLAGYNQPPGIYDNLKPYQPTLIPISAHAKPYISQSHDASHLMPSPREMDNHDPMKSFKSGYKGFVPRHQGQLGSAYRISTHNALNQFTDDIQKKAEMAITAIDPARLHQPEPSIHNPVRVYPVDTGLVPHYAGHIPGEKFRKGVTFGESTKNVRKMVS